MALFFHIAAGADGAATCIEGILTFFAKYYQLQNDIYQTELKQYSTFDNQTKKFIFDETKLLDCVKFRAFIHESMRIANPGVRGLPRALSKTCILSFNMNPNCNCDTNQYSNCGHCYTDIELTSIDEMNAQLIAKVGKKQCKYVIKDDTSIEPNAEFIMNENKQLWDKDPKIFDINRWITHKKYNDNDTNSIHNINETIKFRNCVYSVPFGLGPRACPGKQLATKELYLLFAHLLINYEIYGPNGVKKDFDFQFQSKMPPRTLAKKIDLTIVARNTTSV